MGKSKIEILDKRDIQEPLSKTSPVLSRKCILTKKKFKAGDLVSLVLYKLNGQKQKGFCLTDDIGTTGN